MRSIYLSVATLLLSTTSAIGLPTVTPLLPVAQAQTLPDAKNQADRLFEEGIDRYDNIQFGEALAKFEEALSIYREIGDSPGMAIALHRIGMVYNSLQGYEKALEFYQQAVAIQQEIGDRAGERVTLYRIGKIYGRLEDDRLELEYYQQALAVPTDANDCGDRTWEKITLEGIGGVYQKREEYRQALEYYQQAVAIREEVSNCTDEDVPRSYDRGSTLLKDMGFAYQELGEYRSAIDYYQQALEIVREIEDLDTEWLILNELGVISRRLGEYQQAIDYYEASVAIQRRSMGFVEGFTLSNLGLVYENLGEYRSAIDYYQQALEIARGFGDREDENLTLNNLGVVYRKLGEYRRAIDYYQQALAIVRDIGDAEGESAIFNNLGAAHHSLEEYREAIEYYQQALNITRDLDDRALVGRILNNLGESYRELGESRQAIDYYQQALIILQDIGDKAATGITFRNLGSATEAQNQPELAILFFKQSVNIREAIRDNIEELPVELQQSYTDTIADDYRHLADLLLQQDRILEAQQVLDLLKVEELDNYLGNVRGNDSTARGIPSLPAEREIENGYQAILDRAIATGQELTQLRQNSNRTPQEEQRLVELVGDRETLIRDFNTFIDSDDVQNRIAQLSPQTRKPDLVDDLEDLIGLQDNLQNLQQNAVLFYPLILDDRLELILTTPNSPPLRRTVNVGKEELAQTILEFRRAIVRPHRPISGIQTPAQKLYQWLIEPLENDLDAANAETILYAPDGQLRYIPLAALHDGDRWLVERYRVNNITATSLTDLNSQPSGQLRVLAGAFTTGEYRLTMGEEVFDFAGLPYAGVEVALLAATVPDTTQLFDTAFNLEDTKPQMGDRNILHFATHGAMVVGTPEESFILFGDGTPATVADVRNWNLNGVDLVVLSACETGLGGNLGTGAEILGLGYQMQRAGARASIASLWIVNDGGTQALMNVFYGALQGGSTKAEALRQAQLAMISGENSMLTQPPEILDAVAIPEELRSNMSDRRLQHPYYWASFILIGNGL